MQTQQNPTFRSELSATRVIWLLPILTIAHIAWYYPVLPSLMASHFGPSGKADGFMSKQGFMVFYLGLVLFYCVLFGNMGMLLKKTPDEMINMPNKEYWLAPERREATLRVFSHQMAIFGIAIGAFFLAVMQTIFLTNLGGSHQLDSLFFVYLVGFLLFTTIWTLQMLKQFKVPAT